MALSNDLSSLFAKTILADNAQKSSTKAIEILNGTVVNDSGNLFVKIDGSEQLTPITTTTTIKHGERVTLTIKDHTAVVTGNLSSPSVNQGNLDGIQGQIDEFETIIADTVHTDDLVAINAQIENLIADNVTIKGELTAANATIDQLEANDVTINGKLDAAEATIDKLDTEKLDAAVADIKYATIGDLEVTNADIRNLEADFGDFKDLTTDKFTAVDAEIENLDVGKLSAEEADLKYANIDFANIGEAAIHKLFADSGIIGDLVMNEGHVTGTLVGVTIKGDLIEGGTVVADKLVIQGEDGLYYKLNTNGETISAEQTEYNSLNGSIITAQSVTAEKINVSDLVAFNATIGGYHITDHSLYSGVKTTVDNTTRGTYMDDTGQFAIGDQDNYLKFFQDIDGSWKLDLCANSIKMGTSNKTIEDYIDDAMANLDLDVDLSDLSVGARNLLLESNRSSGGSTNPYTSWQLAEAPIVGEKYTFSMKATADSVIMGFSIYNSGGDVKLADLELVDGIYQATFDWTNGTLEEPSHLDLYFYPDQALPTESVTSVEWAKLERGSLRTDWTPAIEDVTNDILEAKDYTDAQIQVSKEGILLEVDGRFQEVDGSISSMSTRLEQTENTFNFNFENMSKDITDLSEATESKFEGWSRYIRFVDGNIILGEDGNPVTLRIENDQISFLQNNAEVAYITDSQLYITNATITTRLDIGKFSWIPRSNGNVSFQFMG